MNWLMLQSSKLILIPNFRSASFR